MKKLTLPASCHVCLAWTLAILLAAAALSLSATAEERVVLCEEFTAHG